ncbi:MAG TPA: OstA-like protein [Bacteroidales bacterium]|jgi:lipopolysaccharide export system protein LptA|nr:OstA-like protein [Bacteroidales bacterium]
MRAAAFLLMTLAIMLQPCKLQAQETQGRRRVEILHSDSMKYERLDGRTRNRLNGNVRLMHNDLYMNCDSAWYYDDTNQVLAYNNIHIWQGDTIHIRGQFLTYNGDTRKAVLTDSVELTDKEMRLFTDEIDYDVNTQVAVYDNGGRILSGDNTLTSIVGIYYSDQKMLHFRDSVRIVNPDYVMTADTMRYDTSREIAWFAGPSEVVGDSIYLYCENGWSDTRNDVSQLMKNAVLDNREQRITGDTLWYDERKGQGEAFGHVTVTDTSDNITGGGNYAWYEKRPERLLFTGTPWFSLFADDDTLTLRADTLRAIPVQDTAGVNHRLLKAYYSCTIFSREMQGKCDSLAYSFQDSVIRLYDDPIVWSRENQMTADSIALFTVKSKADHMEMYNRAFVVSSVDTARYDQISGKNLSGFFIDNKLYRIEVVGNGEAIYYVVDGNELVGVNRARSATIEIFFEDSKIVEIYQNQSPDGTLNPPLQLPDTEMRLEGFRWHPDLRPDRVSMGIAELFPGLPEASADELPNLPEGDVPVELQQLPEEKVPVELQQLPEEKLPVELQQLPEEKVPVELQESAEVNTTRFL